MEALCVLIDSLQTKVSSDLTTEAVGLVGALPNKVIVDLPTEAGFKVVRDKIGSGEKSVIDEGVPRIRFGGSKVRLVPFASDKLDDDGRVELRRGA